MNKEIVIRSINSAVDFAVLHDGKLIELQKEKERILGGMYSGGIVDLIGVTQ